MAEAPRPFCDQHTVRGELCATRATWVAPASNRAEREAGIAEYYCTRHANYYGIPRKALAQRLP